VKLPKQVAHYKESFIPQIDQLPLVGTLKGIYRWESNADGKQRLVWCFAGSGEPTPKEFAVYPGSKRTMVTLVRYEESHDNRDWAMSVVPKKFLSLLD
jgi:hypothetical protein